MTMLRCAVVCALFTVARADGLQADSLVKVSIMPRTRKINLTISKAQLSFLSIYAFLYLILTALCPPIFLRAGIKRSGYFVLFLSLGFACIGTVSTIFDLVVNNHGITPPPSRLLSTQAVLQSVSTFCGNFSIPLLFLSICMTIRNRQIALHMPSTSGAFPLVYYILFALFMIFAVVHASYDSYFLSIIFTNRIDGHTINWIGQRALIVNDLFYAYSALFYSSSIVILSYVIIVRRQMKQLTFSDKVTTPSLVYMFAYQWCSL